MLARARPPRRRQIRAILLAESRAARRASGAARIARGAAGCLVRANRGLLRDGLLGEESQHDDKASLLLEIERRPYFQAFFFSNTPEYMYFLLPVVLSPTGNSQEPSFVANLRKIFGLHAPSLWPWL